MSPDRLPPNSPEAERGVLGCCLLDPGVFPDAAASVKVEAFYDLRHREIWATMDRLFAEHGRFDLITLQADLSRRGQLEACGGLLYLNEMADAVPSVENLQTYVELLRQKHQERRVVAICTRAIYAMYDPNRDPREVISETQAAILDATEAKPEEREQTLAALMPEVIDVLERFSQGTKVMSGYSTGFNYLDNMMCGWEPGNMYVLCGRPSTGKTSLLLDFILQAATLHGPVAFFSLEMTKLQMALRAVANKGRISFQKFRNGFLKDHEPAQLVKAVGDLAQTPVVIDDTPGLNANDIMMRMRRMMRVHGVKICCIDYLQLMSSVTKYRERRDAVAEASERLKSMAKRLKIPVIVLAQLNREVEKGGKWRKPVLSDLAESGDIEQDADFVGALYRARLDTDVIDPAKVTVEEAKAQFDHMDRLNQREWYWLRNLNSGVGDDWKRPLGDVATLVNLAVLKQRNGPTGDVGFVYYKEQMRFADAWKGE